MSDPLVSVENFVLARDGRTLVTGERWTVGRGERILLTGASGSGKSSFLLALAGLVDHSPGLEWQAHTHGSPSVGLLLQNPYSQLVCPTADQEIAFALENRGWDLGGMMARVDELKAAFGLTPLGHRSPWTFSGGEAQRLSLAAVMAPGPELVLLDEPLGFLDGPSSVALMQSIGAAGRQTAWVVVDHDPRPWAAWADRHYRLTEGRWVQEPIPTLVEASGAPGGFPRPTQPPLLEVAGLTAGYGRGPDVLHSFDLTLASGETVALVGPSGAGKSTLFRCLTGQLKPRSGQLRLEGVPFRPRLNRPSPFFWVPQVPEQFFLHATAREEWAGAEEAARAFGLETLADRHPFTLSEGEKRRLNLAAALAARRPILLLDEPQYGLDAASRRELERALTVVQDQGQSALIISHEPDFCRRVAHRTVEVGA